MKIYLTTTEVCELACSYLDLMNPNEDRIHEIAEKMDMVYDEHLDLFEDVEEHSISLLKQNLKHNLVLLDIEIKNTAAAVKELDTIRKEMNNMRMAQAAPDALVDWSNKNLGTDFTKSTDN